jgi:hypothetical protein
LLEGVVSLCILIWVAGQAGRYTLPRDMLAVGWWKGGWELVPILTTSFGVLGKPRRRRRGVCCDISLPSLFRRRTFRNDAAAYIDNRRGGSHTLWTFGPERSSMKKQHWVQG